MGPEGPQAQRRGYNQRLRRPIPLVILTGPGGTRGPGGVTAGDQVQGAKLGSITWRPQVAQEWGQGPGWDKGPGGTKGGLLRD